MVTPAQKITARPATKTEAWPHLLRAAEFDTTGGTLTAEEALSGSVLSLLHVDGVPVGASAIKITQHQRGKVLWLMAVAADMPGVDLTVGVSEFYEQQARDAGVGCVALVTRRRGLVKKLEALGYEVTGVTLRKKL